MALGVGLEIEWVREEINDDLHSPRPHDLAQVPTVACHSTLVVHSNPRECSMKSKAPCISNPKGGI